MKVRKSTLGWAIALMMILSAAALAVRAEEAQPAVVTITAKRFQFTPDHITLKKGQPVILRLTSEDVTHGFFSRPLKVDAEIAPGKITEVKITPDQVGKFTLICDHFCGVGHGNMMMTIEVVE